MLISILAIIPGFIPSCVLGVVKPLSTLKKAGEISLHITLSQMCSENDISKADVVIFSRSTTIQEYRLLVLAKKYNKRIIYDIDDNFFDISVEKEIGRFHRNPVNLYFHSRFLMWADLVIVYSTAMYNKMRFWNPNVSLSNAYFDFSIIAGMEDKSLDSRFDPTLKIAYPTGIALVGDVAAAIEKAFLQIFYRYPQVFLHIWGNVPSKLQEHPNVVQMEYEPDYDCFIRKFKEMNFDIGIAPLSNDVFNICKSNNKYREFGACKVAGIYSNVEVYNHCISSGHNGILVENDADSWVDALEKLILNYDLRSQICSNAYKDIFENYSMDSLVRKYRDQLYSFYKNEEKAIDTSYINDLTEIRVLVGIGNHYPRHLLEWRLHSVREVLGLCGIRASIRMLCEISLIELEDFDALIVFSQNEEKDIDLIDCLTDSKPAGLKIIWDIYALSEEYLQHVQQTSILDRIDRLVVAEAHMVGKLMCGNNTHITCIPTILPKEHVNKLRAFVSCLTDIDSFLKPIKSKLTGAAKRSNSLKNLRNSIQNRVRKQKGLSSQTFHFSVESPIFSWLEIFQTVQSRNPRRFSSRFTQLLHKTPIVNYAFSVSCSIWSSVQKRSHFLFVRINQKIKLLRMNVLHK